MRSDAPGAPSRPENIRSFIHYGYRQVLLMESTPVFRKSILPWYDTNAACWFLLVIMAAVLVFAIEGLRIAAGSGVYRPHAWMPFLLIVLSSAVCVSLIVRLAKRCRNGSHL